MGLKWRPMVGTFVADRGGDMSYSIQSVDEDYWQKRWDEEKIFVAEVSETKPHFTVSKCILTHPGRCTWAMLEIILLVML